MGEKSKLVIDASVVVKWFVREDDRAPALNLRELHVSGRVELLAPDLLVYEVANALRFNPHLDAGDVERAVESLFKLHIRLCPPSVALVADAARKAKRYGITVYDAAYMSLAEDEACNMVTADGKLYGKVKGSGVVLLLPSDELNDWLKWKS
ncbi:MAG: type II toxin-antitoxin system VapC family toxin [Candidatus Jordarchaeales archaeon]|nr:type II toxin-antitoxin system VapC family toxin [Candidatus Jordarchaeia archaeon]